MGGQGVNHATPGVCLACNLGESCFTELKIISHPQQTSLQSLVLSQHLPGAYMV